MMARIKKQEPDLRFGYARSDELAFFDKDEVKYKKEYYSLVLSELDRWKKKVEGWRKSLDKESKNV